MNQSKNAIFCKDLYQYIIMYTIMFIGIAERLIKELSPRINETISKRYFCPRKKICRLD